MDLEYIIVQAGGKGTRMKKLTQNKPKALVPVNNLPLIFHLFKKFSDKKFIIIGDYKIDVLKKYLEAFANVSYSVVDAKGKKGTCSGIKDALNLIPENRSFMLVWSDLVLSEKLIIPQKKDNYVGISKSFVCRWKYENNGFIEEPSKEYGVAGLFLFKEKSLLAHLPFEGEFVRWLQGQNIEFKELDLAGSKEYGTTEAFGNDKVIRCRPFNELKIYEKKVVKKPVDTLGTELAVREITWYKKVRQLGFHSIPEIYSYEPLCMERIKGKNIFECGELPFEEKRSVLKNIVEDLKKLHESEDTDVSEKSFYDAYIEKTFSRLQKVRNLIPFSENETLTINNKECRNVFFQKEALKEKIMQYVPKRFKLIHGDCTFSNIMLREDNKPVFIDPRGYFGETELFGDEAYDWAKLYYSLFTNYDRFNSKNFTLEISERSVTVEIASNNWEALESDFFEMIGEAFTKEQIRLIVAIIWLSLTTYAWEDYDSICAAFYNGLYYLEEVL